MFKSSPLKIFITIILLVNVCANLCAQVNVQNNNTLFISTTSDTLYINGSFTNSSAAGLTNNGNLYVEQDINNDQSSLPAGTGTLYLDGAVSQNVGGSQKLNTNNFVIDNNAGITLSNDMSVKSTFTLSNGNLALNSNYITLISDINNTANVAPVAGSITYGTGKFIVERFVLAPRSWRFLTAPITTTTQTINNAWQEGQAGATNTLPGYGTHITGGTIANGFDQGVNLNPGIKQYTAGLWTAISNTNSTLITNQQGYMLFVRGDRSVILSQGTGAASSNTVLRTTGQLKTGNQTYTVTATGFTVIGNPYASPIDLFSLTKTNVQNNFYLWDPKITGSNGVGGFVNISWNGSTYDVTPSTGGSGLNQYVQSGSAFLAKTIDGATAGTLVIKETDKSSTPSMNVSRSANISATIKTNLYALNSDGTTSIVDGILNSYSTIYSDSIDEYDAPKIKNFSESLSSQRQGQSLVAERRSPIGLSDTIFLNMLQMKVKSYQFEIKPDNFNSNISTAYLEDTYTNTSTPINLQSTTIYNFNVINVPGSWNPSRFRIVFIQSSALPVTFNNIKANAENADIKVEWKVENQSDIKQYEIEKSSDGQKFVKVKSVTPNSNTNSSGYNWLDESAFQGNNYYRIKSISSDGDVKYSPIVKVYMGNDMQQITLTTNVISNKIITIKMNNMPQGIYGVSITNSLGQNIYSKKIEHKESSSIENIQLNADYATGIYHLNIIKPDLSGTTLKFLLN